MNRTVKRIAAAFALFLAALIAVPIFAVNVALETGAVHFYGGPHNAGAAVRVYGCTGIGYEYQGQPGVFTDVCQ